MIPLPTSVKVIEKKGNKAVFQIEGLYPGYGVTIGNSLRRVLLSSLEGAAITQIKIKGVNHEFSTIPGVLEDVIMIIINLKKLSFKSHAQEPQKAVLKVKGEKVVKAADFDLPSQVEISNPEQTIATLTSSKSRLEMEAQIERGVGYVPAEAKTGQKREIGVIPIDAIYSPVKKVGFHVENMRVGKRTDFDRLLIEIETDGTISPAEALAESSKILLEHFSLFSETLKKAPEPKQSKKEPSLKREDDVKKMKIEELKISERTKNVLLGNNIKTIGAILKKSKEDLLKIERLGDKAVKEINKALKKLGFELS